MSSDGHFLQPPPILSGQALDIFQKMRVVVKVAEYDVKIRDIEVSRSLSQLSLHYSPLYNMT